MSIELISDESKSKSSSLRRRMTQSPPSPKRPNTAPEPRTVGELKRPKTSVPLSSTTGAGSTAIGSACSASAGVDSAKPSSVIASNCSGVISVCSPPSRMITPSPEVSSLAISVWMFDPPSTIGSILTSGSEASGASPVSGVTFAVA